MFSLKTVVAILGVLGIVFHLAESLCTKTHEEENGCAFEFVEKSRSSCYVAYYTSSWFVFYVRPGDGFKYLVMSLSKEAILFPAGSLRFVIDRDHLPDADKWYVIKFVSDSSRSYSLYIDGSLVWTRALLISKASSVSFALQGSLFFSSKCNPSDSSLLTTSVVEEIVSSATESQDFVSASLEMRGFDASTNNNLLTNLVIVLSVSAIALIAIGSVVAFFLVKLIRKRKRNSGNEMSKINRSCRDPEVYGNERRPISNEYYFLATRSSSESGLIFSREPRCMDISEGTNNIITEEPIYEELESIYEEVDEEMIDKI